MPTSDENKCYRQRLCVTLQPPFQVTVMRCVGRMDVLVDQSDFSNEGLISPIHSLAKRILGERQ